MSPSDAPPSGTPPSDTPKVRLIAQAPIPTAAVSIFDGSLHLVARGGGRVETEVVPGIYKVVCSTGQDDVSRILEVTPDQNPASIEFAGISLRPPRPAPSADRLAAIEQVARTLSTMPGIPQGTGSECFVFAMDVPNDSGPAATAASTPFSGLKLLTFGGTILADFTSSSPQDGCTGLNVSVDPGSYLLRLDGPGGDSIEQTIVTCPGWQTQVLLPLQNVSASSAERAPNLENATVLMSRTGSSVPLDHEYVAWIELARKWLAQGEPIAPVARLDEAVKTADAIRAGGLHDEQLRNALGDKFTNPMLGIYAAHLMMCNPSPAQHELELLKEVAKNLRLLLGEHPDVTAIDLWLDENAPAGAFERPPMLRDSWKVIVNRSRKRGSLTPAGSYALRVSDRLWGSGAWLIWRTPPAAEAAAQPAVPAVAKSAPFGISLPSLSWISGERKLDLSKLPDAIGRKMGSQGQGIAHFLRTQDDALNLTGAERTLLAYIASVQQGQATVGTLIANLERIKWLGPLSPYVPRFRSALQKKTSESVVDLLSVDRMVDSLGLPRAAVDEALTGLARKLGI